MTRPCTVCVHPKRAEIDAALIAGQTPEAIEAHYHPLRRSSVQRHKASHLPETLALASQANEAARADTLLEQVRNLQSKALGILEKAEHDNDLRIALMAIREARGNLELLARLLGELQENQTVNVLVASPEWLTLRGRILEAVEPFPAARAALAEALQHAG